MGDIAIQVEKLGKQYRIGAHQPRYKRFTETAMDVLTAPIHRLRRLGQPVPSAETIWALKDVSFEVKEGEVVGIIGRNGAGKSTLLKILSRITEPTEGEARVYGRVGSLLEVGTGFHPELTGRENIYLNGTILGMKKAEIERKFDEIVAFAEVDKFLDTPVKRYSSGMYVRLAFAVAAHLEPEVLVVDEVLAVGDSAFQKKCLGKMKNVSQQGRTVLFVSHNLQAIKSLCSTAILLREGNLSEYTDVEAVVQAYLSSTDHQMVNLDIRPEMHLTYPPDFEVFRIELLNRQNEPTASLLMDEQFAIRLFYRIRVTEQSYRIGIVFRNNEGVRLATVISTDNGMPHISGDDETDYYLTVRSRNIFLPGAYTVELHVKNFFNQSIDVIEGIHFSVEPASVIASSKSYGAGIVRLEASWATPERQEAPAIIPSYRNGD